MNKSLSFAALALVAATAACSGAPPEPVTPVNGADPSGPAPTGAQKPPPAPASAAAETSPQERGTEVLLCDGKTKAVFPQGTSGEHVASALMNEWLRKNPESGWESGERERHTLEPAADNRHLLAEGQGPGQGQTYGRITEQDVTLWKMETERLALAGSRVFHSADELGSTISVSCDMCHPHAANTHPETYPKFQAQLGRVVLLRDMINWCLQHPVRAQPLNADDPRMRAMEAYIYAQRRGKTLDYGKH